MKNILFDNCNKTLIKMQHEQVLANVYSMVPYRSVAHITLKKNLWKNKKDCFF